MNNIAWYFKLSRVISKACDSTIIKPKLLIMIQLTFGYVKFDKFWIIFTKLLNIWKSLQIMNFSHDNSMSWMNRLMALHHMVPGH